MEASSESVAVPRRTFRIARLLALPALLLGACQPIGVLHPRGPVGAANATILLNSLFIMLAIVVPTIVATIGFAWWFRASNPKAVYRPDFAYSGRVELLVWSIPLLTIMFLGGIAWVGSHELDPFRPLASDKTPLNVQVVSLDWKWLFVYPDERVASVNELVVEDGRPVALQLTSASVMNAFFVPQLGSMIYTMNGMTSQLHLQADGTGEFEGLSSHLSGDGFAGMRFRVRSVSGADYGAWITAARESRETLDRARYDELAKQSSYVQPFTFKEVSPGLFDAIVRQTIPPAPGPDQGRGGPGVSPQGQSALPPGAIGVPQDGSAAMCTPASPRGAMLTPAGAAKTRG